MLHGCYTDARDPNASPRACGARVSLPRHLPNPHVFLKLSIRGNASAISLISLRFIFFSINRNENYLAFWIQRNCNVLKESSRKLPDDHDHYYNGGGNENFLCRLMYLNNWSPVGGIIWGNLWTFRPWRLAVEVCHWELLWEYITLPHPHFQLLLAVSRVPCPVSWNGASQLPALAASWHVFLTMTPPLGT